MHEEDHDWWMKDFKKLPVGTGLIEVGSGGSVCPTRGHDLLYGGKCNEIGIKFSPDLYCIEADSETLRAFAHAPDGVIFIKIGGGEVKIGRSMFTFY
ncbi:hypothetical protein AVEN_181870-1 [Araneus ventricosus]|uniref:Uncharacterized protein n=1 Tax=Araneus ventricosus TaxID=182803 RepID=A0A4Y2VHV8_ARAVE|nr:hypothetical protein AVEN_181870-1 [Araneus ventricosus]